MLLFTLLLIAMHITRYSPHTSPSRFWLPIITPMVTHVHKQIAHIGTSYPDTYALRAALELLKIKVFFIPRANCSVLL